MRRQRRRHRYRWRDYRVVRAVVGDVGATGMVVCELGAVGVVVGVVLWWVGVGKVLGYRDAHDNNGGDGSLARRRRCRRNPAPSSLPRCNHDGGGRTARW
jgi:hypothetical protein